MPDANTATLTFLANDSYYYQPQAATGMAEIVFNIFDNMGNGGIAGTLTVDGQPYAAQAGTAIVDGLSPRQAHAVTFHDPSGAYQDVAFQFVPLAGFNPVDVACYPKGVTPPPPGATGSVRVHVQDSQRDALVGATVQAGSFSAQTDYAGNATLALPTNIYPIVASKAGFAPASVTIEVSAISSPQNPSPVLLTLQPLAAGQPQPPAPPSAPYYPPGTGVQGVPSGGAPGPSGGPALPQPAPQPASGSSNTPLLALAALGALALAFAPEDFFA